MAHAQACARACVRARARVCVCVRGGEVTLAQNSQAALDTKPAIAQLVEHLTVDYADIRWSLVRFRVAGTLARTSLRVLASASQPRPQYDNWPSMCSRVLAVT